MESGWCERLNHDDTRTRRRMKENTAMFISEPRPTVDSTFENILDVDT